MEIYIVTVQTSFRTEIFPYFIKKYMIFRERENCHPFLTRFSWNSQNLKQEYCFFWYIKKNNIILLLLFLTMWLYQRFKNDKQYAMWRITAILHRLNILHDLARLHRMPTKGLDKSVPTGSNGYPCSSKLILERTRGTISLYADSYSHHPHYMY